MKYTAKYVNVLLLILSVGMLMLLQSYTHISTSLLSVLPEDNTKKIIEKFQKVKSSNLLLVTVKGTDENALEKMHNIEHRLEKLPHISLNKAYKSHALLAHQNANKMRMYDINETKLSALDVSQALEKLHTEMFTSFFPQQIDKIDPFKLLIYPKAMKIAMKNGHLTLGDYGYLAYFTLKSKNLKMHQYVYDEIHKVLLSEKDIVFFSPLFYFVENSRAIRADVHKIIYLSMAILFLLYFIILRDVVLLLHTVITLTTSASIATLVLTQHYEHLSVFVFVFGISVSTVAIDYMFHHYFHGHYAKHKQMNRSVLFGFLTTILAFFIFSFSTFLLIKQISIFAIISLSVSYVIFSFLYPYIGFHPSNALKKKDQKVFCNISPKVLFFVAILLLFMSANKILFDTNLRHLDYSNTTLKHKELFFKKYLHQEEYKVFSIQANTIDGLISRSQRIQNKINSVHIPLASLESNAISMKNKEVLDRHGHFKTQLTKAAQTLGFKKHYFDDAYAIKGRHKEYHLDDIEKYGLTMVRIGKEYITFGRVHSKEYAKVLQYNFVHSLSLKEHFEKQMHISVERLKILGLLVILMIVSILFYFARNKIIYGIIFLLFPLAMMGVLTFFVVINIMHIFMAFIILAIGIDYAIYMISHNDLETKRAISYSLLSTFAGFGVLIFSNINALYSIGSIATIGIVSIYFLLLCMKGNINNET